jgi:hypothetical protein
MPPPNHPFRSLPDDGASTRPQRQPDPGADQQHGEHGSTAHQIHGRRGVLTRVAIILKAIQQHLVERRTDLARCRFDQRQAIRPRRVLDAIQVAGDAAFGSEHDQDGCVGELPAPLDPLIAESGSVGQFRDRIMLAGQKMPTLRGTGLVDRLEHAFFLEISQAVRLVGIDTDGDDGVVVRPPPVRFPPPRRPGR